MSRNIPAGIDLSQDTTLAMCLQVTDRRGQVHGFTEHDRSLTLDLGDGLGPIDYKPEAGFGRHAAEARATGGAGSIDLVGFIDAAGLSETLVLGGLIDSALAKLFLVDWTQPAAGVIWIEIGEFEEIRVEDDALAITFKSLLERYNNFQIGDLYQVDCVHQLGSQPGDLPRPFAGIGCRFQLDPPSWAPGLEVLVRAAQDGRPTGFETAGSPSQVNTVRPSAANGRFFEAESGGVTGGSEPAWNLTLGGTTSDNGVVWVTRQAWRETRGVLAATDQSNLVVAYDGDAEDNFYRRGRLKFLTGANAGVEKHIKSASKLSPDGLAVTTWLPFPFAIESGSPEDRVELIVGCDRTLATCVGKFRNRQHFMGAAVFAPTTDEVFKIPRQKTT